MATTTKALQLQLPPYVTETVIGLARGFVREVEDTKAKANSGFCTRAEMDKEIRAACGPLAAVLADAMRKAKGRRSAAKAAKGPAEEKSRAGKRKGR